MERSEAESSNVEQFDLISIKLYFIQIIHSQVQFPKIIFVRVTWIMPINISKHFARKY